MDHRHFCNRTDRRREGEAWNSNLLTVLFRKPSNSDGTLGGELDRALHCTTDTTKPKVKGAEAFVRGSDGEGRCFAGSVLNVESCEEENLRGVGF